MGAELSFEHVALMAIFLAPIFKHNLQVPANTSLQARRP
jgi:hypothetical protein